MSLTESRNQATTELDLPYEPVVSVPSGSAVIGVDLELKHAGRRRLNLRCEWIGPVTAPAIWLAGGISAHRHVAATRGNPAEGWWQEAIGTDKALNPARFRLLSFDWIGATGDLDAPIDSADQADAIAAILDRLGVPELYAFVGASYGAMVGLQFAARHPQRLRRLIALSGAHRPHPFATAYRALQRDCVRFGERVGHAGEALSLARQFAMLSYRTPQEFGERFEAPVALRHGAAHAECEDYLHACGERYSANWKPTAFLRLSESIDLHRVDPADVQVRTTLLSVIEDWLAPPHEIDALADAINAPTDVVRISSRYGHDAFLKETDTVDALLRRALHVSVG